MGNRLALGSVVRASSRQASTQLDGEVVILGLDAGEYFTLTEVGSRIWELIASPVAVRELCLQLQAEYTVNAEQCEAETQALLQSLQEAGLLDVVAEAGA